MTARRGSTSERAAAPLTTAVTIALTMTLAAGLSACGSSPPKEAPGTASVVPAPARVAQTTAGPVGYRVVGRGPPLVLIMGEGWTMEDWDPRLVHALAAHHRVVMFDNSGVGRTRPLAVPFSIDDMAGQTSALISTLQLGRPDVLGWSLGGAVAQALAVLHPDQVGRLVLCATFPGTGSDQQPPPAAAPNRSDFPANQAGAYVAFKAAIAEYPAAPGPASAGPGPGPAVAGQSAAFADWLVGQDPSGRQASHITAPTLIADGTDDQLDPVINDQTLAGLIRGSRLKLYPDAGHAFLFQDWSSFATLVNSFL